MPRFTLLKLFQCVTCFSTLDIIFKLLNMFFGGCSCQLVGCIILKGASERIRQIRSLTSPEIYRSEKEDQIEYSLSDDMDPSLLSREALRYGFEFNKDAWGRLGGWPYCTCIQLYAGVIGGYMYTV
eukprot:GHVO01009640.1.p1 GENE.GHVO01009640.1~~GHVO01009640.1.p1  ORF type:complete len:126 (+),score=11.27 GHVO01009640.1:1-378(+)